MSHEELKEHYLQMVGKTCYLRHGNMQAVKVLALFEYENAWWINGVISDEWEGNSLNGMETTIPACRLTLLDAS